MRKFKTFFGTAMLCIIMVSCGGGFRDPDRPIPSRWSEGRLFFDPIELKIEGRASDYRSRDGNNYFTMPLNLHRDMFMNFFQIIDLSNFGPFTTNESYISVTTTHPRGHTVGHWGNSRTRTFTSTSDTNLRPNGFFTHLFWYTDVSENALQRINVNIRSGPYRRWYGGQRGWFLWEWTRTAKDLDLDQFPNCANTLIEMIESGNFQADAGTARRQGRFVRAIPPPDHNVNAICVCGALHNRPPPPPGQSFPICDCMLVNNPNNRLPMLPPDFRFQYTIDGSRFTEVAQVSDGDDWFRRPNTVVVMPVQTGPNTGTLTVYATEAAYRELVSR